RGVTVFTRDVTIGGKQFTEGIQKQLKVFYEGGGGLEIGGGRGEAGAGGPPGGGGGVGRGAEQGAREGPRSLDFYPGPPGDTKFSKVYLSGGTAKIPALFKTIEARVGVPVEIANPFKNVVIDSRRFDPGFIMDVAPMAAVAVGLALRRPGDKLV